MNNNPISSSNIQSVFEFYQMGYTCVYPNKVQAEQLVGRSKSPLIYSPPSISLMYFSLQFIY